MGGLTTTEFKARCRWSLSQLPRRKARHKKSMHGPYRLVLMRDPCVYCGGHAQGLDHVVARWHGGSDGWENRAPACTRCDRAKGSRPLLRFLLSRRAA